MSRIVKIALLRILPKSILERIASADGEYEILRFNPARKIGIFGLI